MRRPNIRVDAVLGNASITGRGNYQGSPINKMDVRRIWVFTTTMKPAPNHGDSGSFCPLRKQIDASYMYMAFEDSRGRLRDEDEPLYPYRGLACGCERRRREDVD